MKAAFVLLVVACGVSTTLAYIANSKGALTSEYDDQELKKIGEDLKSSFLKLHEIKEHTGIGEYLASTLLSGTIIIFVIHLYSS